MKIGFGQSAVYRPRTIPSRRSSLHSLTILKPAWLFYKRASDLVMGAMLLLAIMPAMILIALLIKIDSPGPILFRQNRRGRGGLPFGCFKFRTMFVDHADYQACVQSRRNDPRVTRIGKFLRRASLDEVPQLFNVLLGDMSLVGPRPHAFGTAVNGRLLPDIAEDYLHRYVVRPGITGWAQVHNCRGILETEEHLHRRLDHDFYYIVNWSPLLDLRILFHTIKCVFDREAF